MTTLDVIVLVLWAMTGALVALALYAGVRLTIDIVRARKARHRRHREINRKSIADAYAQLIRDQQPEVDRLTAELNAYGVWIRNNPDEFRRAMAHWLGTHDELAGRRADDQAIEIANDRKAAD